MARHSSPRGRRATTGSPLWAEPLVRRAAAVRPLLQSTPVRRGAAAVAVTGGAISLMGAAAPQSLDVTDVAAATQLPAQLPGETALPGVVMVSAITPVAPDLDELDGLDPTGLVVKALQMGEELAARLEAERIAAEEEARAEAERAAAEAAAEAAETAEAERRAGTGGGGTGAGADCGIDTDQLGAVKSHVREAAELLGCAYDVDTMHGVAGRAGTSDHPAGRAVDFMTDRASGDALADCALENMDALGVSYIIWEQRINHGSGWELMEDRGGVTANHFDHVHISFDGNAGGKLTSC